MSRDGFRLAVGGVNVARVLQWTASTWDSDGAEPRAHGIVDDPDIADDELFGAAVSLSGDGARVAVGSTSYAAETGRARV